MAEKVEILNIDDITHDVRAYTFERPDGYSFTPGQATEVAIDKEGWREEKRPFTFTNLQDDHLEFVIKSYPDHKGVTEQIARLEEGDQFIIDDAWGTIEYKGEGVFLAGGAGVTPFIAILRDLYDNNEIGSNTLIFSNKTENDIILRDEFEEMLGDRFMNIITDESTDEYINLDGFIDKEFLADQIDDFDQPFYVCGPPAFNDVMIKYLKELGANPDALVFEE
ncbi:FAD-binding oxidoreductase [Fodinibius sp. SL11]|uniref:FAD-binding oxidoreductase n=1 Tax=Fodinibius sp. SL11 TaxID=3425690 RepID=UPI003F883098